ncbi:sugar ABC transporter substrate-binding protein [uncultured Oscillibacter sp.]|uniref:sugar ABC transporter substrate-binding protein n=1 Tax=uncultured Oscillibacter sp. TaxID=876091 RepID=UPI0025DF4106|nr:sugar ABC transporter substrate-binding protein [uncultured Oscillibacter sp.]
MKKFFALALALVMALSLVACGQKEDTPAEEETPATEEEGGATSDIEVAVVLKTLASEYWGYVEAGCKAAEKDLGIKVTVVGPGAESDIEGQVAMIEQQIGAGCDAIVCAPNDAGAAAGALQAALDAGIPVLSVDTNVGIEGQTSFVGTSNVDAAKQGGLWAAEQVGEGANAVIIYGQEGDNTSNMRRQGYEEACEEAGVTVLAALSGQNTTDGATKTMEDLLNAYPDQIDIVLCHNDDTAIGAMNACKNAGVSDMTIVGFDGNQSAVDLILAGEMVKATVAQQPYEMGYQVVEAAVKAINDEDVEATINAPVEVVTAENGQEYLDSLAAMKG